MATKSLSTTSGSTGVSKPVQLSHGYLVGQARLTSRYFDLRESDVVYCPFPLYHWDATIGTVMGSLVTGATAALGEPAGYLYEPDGAVIRAELVADLAARLGGHLLDRQLKEWRRRKRELALGQITPDEYMNWKLNWPLTSDNAGRHSQRKAWRETPPEDAGNAGTPGPESGAPMPEPGDGF